jgi:hypothetical protein
MELIDPRLLEAIEDPPQYQPTEAETKVPLASQDQLIELTQQVPAVYDFGLGLPFTESSTSPLLGTTGHHHVNKASDMLQYNYDFDDLDFNGNVASSLFHNHDYSQAFDQGRFTAQSSVARFSNLSYNLSHNIHNRDLSNTAPISSDNIQDDFEFPLVSDPIQYSQFPDLNDPTVANEWLFRVLKDPLLGPDNLPPEMGLLYATPRLRRPNFPNKVDINGQPITSQWPMVTEMEDNRTGDTAPTARERKARNRAKGKYSKIPVLRDIPALPDTISYFEPKWKLALLTVVVTVDDLAHRIDPKEVHPKRGPIPNGNYSHKSLRNHLFRRANQWRLEKGGLTDVSQEFKRANVLTDQVKVIFTGKVTRAWKNRKGQKKTSCKQIRPALNKLNILFNTVWEVDAVNGVMYQPDGRLYLNGQRIGWRLWEPARPPKLVTNIIGKLPDPIVLKDGFDDLNEYPSLPPPIFSLSSLPYDLPKHKINHQAVHTTAKQAECNNNANEIFGGVQQSDTLNTMEKWLSFMDAVEPPASLNFDSSYYPSTPGFDSSPYYDYQFALNVNADNPAFTAEQHVVLDVPFDGPFQGQEDYYPALQNSGNAVVKQLEDTVTLNSFPSDFELDENLKFDVDA